MGTEQRRRNLPAGYEMQISSIEIDYVSQEMGKIFDSVIQTNSVRGWPEPAQQTLKLVIVDLLVALHYRTNGRWSNVHTLVEPTKKRIEGKVVRGSEMQIIVSGENEGLLKTPPSLTNYEADQAGATKGTRNTLIQALSILQNGASPKIELKAKPEKVQNTIRSGTQRSTKLLKTWHSQSYFK